MKKEKDSMVGGPLMCWDLFMEKHFERLQQAESLSQLQGLAQQENWRIDWDLEKLMLREGRVVLLTNTEQVIRYASANMPAMNGYLAEEVIGCTPKIFQGRDTNADTRRQIREAIVRRLPFKGVILNYRRDGSPYQCLVEEYPVWDTTGKLVNFIAFEKIA